MPFYSILLVQLINSLIVYASLVINVDYATDTVPLANNCFPISNGLCNLRSAWSACEAFNSKNTSILCSIDIPYYFNINISYMYGGGLIMKEESNIELYGNGATITYIHNISEGLINSANDWIPIINSNFPFATGILSETASAQANFKTSCVSACYGDSLRFSGCASVTVPTDTYWRLFDPYGQEIASNDDTCKLVSKITTTLTSSAICGNYCLHMGCYGMRSCGPVIADAFIRKATIPANQIYSGDFPLVTGDLSKTNSAQQNYIIACVNASFKDVIMFTSCNGDQAQDTYFRLFDGSQEVTSNDNACGRSSEIRYTVTKKGNNQFCLHVGCSGNVNCSTVVDAFIVDNPVPKDIEFHNDFPYTTGILRNTQSATKNVEIACINTCQFDTILFTACNGNVQQDTYFRLFDGNSSFSKQVASNDDACSHASAITYTILSPGCGQQLCLHIGCSMSQSCSAVVEAYITRENNSSLPNFIFYQQSNYVSMATPSLFIFDLKLRAFGNPYINGGTLYINGPCNIYLSNVEISQSTGSYGGAIYLNNNMNGTIYLQNSTIKSSTALMGGGIYIDRYVNGFTLNSSIIQFCISTSEWTTNENSNYHSEFGGGGIYVNEYNDNIALIDSSIVDCISSSEGGGVFIHQYNRYISIVDVVFQHNIANYIGGCLYAFRYNDYLSIMNSRFLSCTAIEFSGGGTALFQHNLYPVISNCMFARTSCSRNGAAIHFDQGNDHGIITMNDFIDSSGVDGGAIAISNQFYNSIVSSNITISFSRFALSNGYRGAYYIFIEYLFAVSNYILYLCRWDYLYWSNC
jgi:hypothetical protein